jgi:uncharacterized membrane protein YfcA
MVVATRLFLASLLGFITGCLSGAFGIGGGVFSTPAIRLILQEPAGIALGTTLPLAIPSAVVGGFNYWSKGEVNRRALSIVAPVGAAASLGGALLTRYLNLHWLMVATAVLIIYMAARTAREALGERRKASGVAEPAASSSAFSAWKYALIGLMAGLMAGLLGLGGGVVMIPSFLLWTNMEVKEALGTSLIAIAFIVLPATVVHSLLGHIDWALCLAMSLGAAPGSWLGSRYTLRAQARRVLLLFSLLLALTGIIFIVNELRILF